jgi:DNA-binding transcriptional regulator YbjK
VSGVGASSDRRTQIADAAIDVLAAAGARGLTHRAVDAAARLPTGSTSYYFRSREALLIAAARRLADLDLAIAGAAARRPTSIDDVTALLARLVHAQATTYRDRTLARYHLSLEADRYPEVRAALDEQGRRFADAATELLAQLGSARPARDARAVIALCAGIVYESTVGAQQPYPPVEIRTVLADVLRTRLDGHGRRG